MKRRRKKGEERKSNKCSAKEKVREVDTVGLETLFSVANLQIVYLT
jgi:hypothetical protein